MWFTAQSRSTKYHAKLLFKMRSQPISLIPAPKKKLVGVITIKNACNYLNTIRILPDRKTQSPSEAVIQKEMSQKLRRSLKALSPREEWVIKQRFGIDHRKDHTLEEIGSQLGISRERVRQIEKKALKELKNAEYEKGLKSFWDIYG